MWWFNWNISPQNALRLMRTRHTSLSPDTPESWPKWVDIHRNSYWVNESCMSESAMNERVLSAEQTIKSLILYIHSLLGTESENASPWNKTKDWREWDCSTQLKELYQWAKGQAEYFWLAHLIVTPNIAHFPLFRYIRNFTCSLLWAMCFCQCNVSLNMYHF